MNDKPIRALLIEGDADEAGMIASYLAPGADGAETFTLTRAPRLSTACHLLARQDFDVILIDLLLPQSVGLEGFLKIRALKPAMPIIVLSGLQDEPLAIQALNLGGQDYLIKGSPDCCILKRSIRYAIEKKRLSTAIEGLLAREPGELGARPSLPIEAHGAAPNAAVKTAAPVVEPGKRVASDKLIRLQDKIREGLRALLVKNRFMSRISHELRNTLTTMKTAAYCLKEVGVGPLTPQQRQMVEIISQSVERQRRIVDSVLDLAHFRSGKFRVQFRPTDVGDLIAEVVKEFGGAGKTQTLQVDVDRELPIINADPELIAQVLHNLIDNALRFASRKVVVKAAKTQPKGVTVSVIDDGVGIAPERLGELFTEFSQLGKATTGSDHAATGLGLAICKEIVSGHHGKLWAENGAGQGAQFSFLLPANEKADKAPAKFIRGLTGSDLANPSYPSNGHKQSHQIHK